MTTDAPDALSVRHVVYRQARMADGTERWFTYSLPFGIFVTGTSLAQARDEFRAAARFAINDFDDQPPVEHLERPVLDGLHIRTAIDRRTLDRDEAAATLRAALTLPNQRRDFEKRAPLSANGDVVVVACVPGDQIGWVVEQMRPDEALGICTKIADSGMIWWSFIAGARADVGAEPTETIEEGGLTRSSTISEFMRAAKTSGPRVAQLTGT